MSVIPELRSFGLKRANFVECFIPLQKCVNQNHKEQGHFKVFVFKKIIGSKKWLITLCMCLLFMYVKQKCNFYFQKYDILVIFTDFYVRLTLFWLIFFLYPDPVRDRHHWYGSGFTPLFCSCICFKRETLF